MATLPKLITTLQKVDGRERKTIEQIGRILRESGLLPKGKTGAGAPKMNGRHAAILLLGAYGCSSPKDSPTVASRLRTFTPDDLSESYQMSGILSEIESAQNLEKALAGMIENYPVLEKTLYDFIDQRWRNVDQKKRNLWKTNGGRSALKLEVILSDFNCSMCIKSNSDQHIFWRTGFMVDQQLLSDGFYGSGPADKKVSTTFTQKTFAALHECVCSDLDGNPKQ